MADIASPSPLRRTSLGPCLPKGSPGLPPLHQKPSTLRRAHSEQTVTSPAADRLTSSTIARSPRRRASGGHLSSVAAAAAAVVPAHTTPLDPPAPTLPLTIADLFLALPSVDVPALDAPAIGAVNEVPADLSRPLLASLAAVVGDTTGEENKEERKLQRCHEEGEGTSSSWLSRLFCGCFKDQSKANENEKERGQAVSVTLVTSAADPEADGHRPHHRYHPLADDAPEVEMEASTLAEAGSSESAAFSFFTSSAAPPAPPALAPAPAASPVPLSSSRERALEAQRRLFKEALASKQLEVDACKRELREVKGKLKAFEHRWKDSPKVQLYVCDKCKGSISTTSTTSSSSSSDSGKNSSNNNSSAPSSGSSSGDDDDDDDEQGSQPSSTIASTTASTKNSAAGAGIIGLVTTT